MRNARWLIVVAAVVIIGGCGLGCASYDVRYEEVAEDGSSTDLRISESVGPWAQHIGTGQASAGVDAEGAWRIDLGQETETAVDPDTELLKMLIEALLTRAAP